MFKENFMNATVETLDGLNRRITLNLNQASIEEEVSKRLTKVARTVRIDGFRPGKAPKNIIAARYSGEIRNEVFSDALQQAFSAAITANKLNVAGYPSFTTNEEGAFVATFEVYPELKLGDFSQIKITRPVAEVAEADVDRTLDVLRKQRVQYHAVERATQEGDRINIDFSGQIDGESFPGGESKDFLVTLGEGRTLKEFEGSLSGMKVGEQKSFEVTFPDDYFAKELAGKTAHFNVTVNSVNEPKVPEIDAAFAQSLGIADGDVERLRSEVLTNLTREAKRRVHAKVKEQVFNGLLDTMPIDVPSAMLAMERKALMEKAVTDLKARGMKEADIKLSESVFEQQAKRRVSLGLIMDAIITEQKIVAAENQVRAVVDEFAQSYEDPSEVVGWYYQDATRLKEAKALVLEANVVNWLLEHVQVSDEPINLEALMGNA
jgi:trigger factor